MKTLTIPTHQILNVSINAVQYGVKYKVLVKTGKLEAGDDKLQMHTDDDGVDWKTALIEYQYNVTPGSCCIHFEVACNGARYIYMEYKPLHQHSRSKHAKLNKATFAQFVDAIGRLDRQMHTRSNKERDETKDENLDIFKSLFTEKEL